MLGEKKLKTIKTVYRFSLVIHTRTCMKLKCVPTIIHSYVTHWNDPSSRQDELAYGMCGDTQSERKKIPHTDECTLARQEPWDETLAPIYTLVPGPHSPIYTGSPNGYQSSMPSGYHDLTLLPIMNNTLYVPCSDIELVFYAPKPRPSATGIGVGVMRKRVGYSTVAVAKRKRDGNSQARATKRQMKRTTVTLQEEPEDVQQPCVVSEMIQSLLSIPECLQRSDSIPKTTFDNLMHTPRARRRKTVDETLVSSRSDVMSPVTPISSRFVDWNIEGAILPPLLL
ncbi:hypothetical protein AAMO2058_000659200 [Amorphochlora amoebiformis]